MLGLKLILRVDWNYVTNKNENGSVWPFDAIQFKLMREHGADAVHL